jgi:hypothetical protein
MVNGGFHTMWVVGLLVMQLRQVAVSNMTTNEEMNKWRYAYLIGRKASPWSQG